MVGAVQATAGAGYCPKYWMRGIAARLRRLRGCCGEAAEGLEPRSPNLFNKPRRNMHRLSRFAELLKGLPRDSFQKLVDLHAGDRYTKKFRCWHQLQAMVYAHLAGVSSLRELEAGFNQHRNHHYHLQAIEVHRTTLADANDRRKPKVFEETVRLLIGLAGQAIRKDRKDLLYLIDSTTIPLYGRGCEWAEASATRTQGLKVHVQFESGSQLPVHFMITAANVNDETEGSKLALQAGATYVFDKGYCNYAWWERIAQAKARFVTRLKINAAVREVACRLIPAAATNILSDTVIEFAHKSNRGGHKNDCTRQLRRIEVIRPQGKGRLVLVTNDLESSAVEVAQLYKKRWEIELFFKWIKQHLKIKKFLGESENAVRIQLLTALVAYLLVALLKATKKLPGSLWQVLMDLKTGLFLRLEEEADRWRRRRQQEMIFKFLQPGLFS